MKKRSRWPLWLFPLLIGLVAAGLGWDYEVQRNFGTVVPGKIYRSGQPSEEQLEEWIQEYGLKSILSMRSGLPSYEKELAERHGINLYRVTFSAKNGLDQERWEKIRQILADEDNLPILIHCRGGGDRTGIVTASYRIEEQDWPLDRALREMNRHYHVSPRYPKLHEQLRERFQDNPEQGAVEATP